MLCLESDYFLNAFTGNFKVDWQIFGAVWKENTNDLQEASEGVMELHEDDPEHFEFLLKFMYTGAYNRHEIAKFAGDDKTKRVLVPIGIHAIADKYDVAKLYEPAAEDVKAVFMEASKGQDMLITAIRAHYGTEVNVDGAMGRLLTSVVFEKHQDLVQKKAFEQLLLSYPTFAADAALHSQRSNTLGEGALVKCDSCSVKAVHIVNLRNAGCIRFYCPKCACHRVLP